MTEIATSWKATHKNDDGSEWPLREIRIALDNYNGHSYIYFDNYIGGGPGIAVWGEAQLGQLIAGLIAAAHQSGFDMETVNDFAGLPGLGFREAHQ